MELVKEKQVVVKETQKEIKNRESNFEILRIVAMIMIIFHHLSVHSGFGYSMTEISANKLWIQFIQMGGKIGVNIFVLISGYFLVNTDKIKISKALKLWGQIFFTSLTIYIVFVILGFIKFECKTFIKTLIPIINETWWFASAYFLLYVFSPFLNIILKNIDRNTYKKMICFMVICWCIIPTFIDKNFQFNSFIWFIVLYCMAGYIKLYSYNWKTTNKRYFIFTGILIILTYLTVIFLDKMNLMISSKNYNSNYLFAMQRLPIFLISLFLFLGFMKTKIKYSKIINKLATTTFGIYLIHDNSYMRSFLWKDFFKVKNFEESTILIPYSIFVCCIVFVSCAAIDLIRSNTIEKYYMNIVYRIETKINNKNRKD